MKRIYILVILTTAVDPDGAKAGTQDSDTPSARCLPPRALPTRALSPAMPHRAFPLSLGLLPGRLCCFAARSHRLSFGALSR